MTGSYGDRRLEADASDSWLNNTLGGRLTGAGEYTGSRRHYYLNRYAFAPTLRWRPYDIPLHSGSLWSTYRFANGWGAGGGVYFNTDSFAYTDNLVELPGYPRLDWTVFYHRRHAEIDAHLSNLTNTCYYGSSHSDLELFPGAPISGALMARYHF